MTTGRLVLALLAAVVLGGCPAGAPEPDPAPTRSAAPFVPDDPALVERNNRGVGQMGRFEYDAARDTFAALVAEHPGWIEAKVNLAIATLNRQGEGDEETAMTLLEEVIADDADHLRARYCRGILRMRNGDADGARQDFRFVAEADPEDAYAAYQLGQSSEGFDDAAAIAGYRRAIELDPYLRSAYYRASQMLQRAGKRDEAQRYFEQFRRLEKNPRARLVEIKYTRLGPKAEVIAVDRPDASPAPPPAGPVFAEPGPLLARGATRTWNGTARDRPFGISAADLDGDGDVDLFVADALRASDVVNAVLVNDGSGAFALDADHPLAVVPFVNAALWGDYDNDGRVDVYLCRRGPNALWRQEAAGAWRDVTATTATAGGELDTVDGAFVDADHDGDLDVVCVNADGPNELLGNNLDGTFRPLAAAMGIAGDGRPSRQVVPADLDGDRDVDLVVINAEPPHEVYVNDRLWAYHAVTLPFSHVELVRAVIGDVDADGTPELYAVQADGSAIVAATRTQTIALATRTIGAPAGEPPTDVRQIALVDVTGDGTAEVVRSTRGGWIALDATTGATVATGDAGGAPSWAPVVLDPAGGPSIVAVTADAAQVWRPGPGRHQFATFAFTGRTEKGDSMRSNAAGIGTRAAFRVGSRWTVLRTPGAHAGPGQSLQPLPVGLGGASKVDFVAIDWSDGVFQSEIELAAGARHEIAEAQRQLSSCPVLFAWDGERHRFVTDLLGVGGLGYLLAPGAYAEPRPWENLLLPEDALAPRGRRYVLKLTEPMEEACYLDSARLVRYDLPPGWHMTLDERMAIGGPAPTGEPRFFRREVTPVRATNDRGADVTRALAAGDLAAAPVGALDARFIGRLENDHVLTLAFDAPLDAGPGAAMLVIDGWVEYPYAQTMFAAWQANATYRAPTLEARGVDGAWHVVLEQFGYPAGMPRRMSVPLEGLPIGARELRLTTNQEIYFDRVAVARAEPCPEARRRPLTITAARVAATGFARRRTGPQRLPRYDYDRRAPLWDTRHQRGLYTAFGPALDLVAQTDDAVAIFGPGEEVHLEFAVGLARTPPGWTSRFVLETAGWCKDMDLFTRDGETVEPLPVRGEGDAPPEAGGDGSRREAIHRRYNTRYESGR